MEQRYVAGTPYQNKPSIYVHIYIYTYIYIYINTYICKRELQP